MGQNFSTLKPPNVRKREIIRNVEDHRISQSQRSCTLGSLPPSLGASGKLLKSGIIFSHDSFLFSSLITAQWALHR